MSINLVDDIMEHDEHEVIEFLYNELAIIRKRLIEDENSSNVDKIELAYQILKALNRRNKERGLQ